MLNEASLHALRTKLLHAPDVRHGTLRPLALTPQEAAFLSSLIQYHMDAIKANELYLTPFNRPSVTQPIPAVRDVLQDGEVPTYPKPKEVLDRLKQEYPDPPAAPEPPSLRRVREGDIPPGF